MAITKVTRNMLTTGIVDNSNATAITIDSSENCTFAGTVNGLTLAQGNITGADAANFTINTANSVRINIDSNDSGTGESFIVGHNQTAINQSNILLKVEEDGKFGIGIDPTHHFNLQGTGTVEARFRSSDGDMSLQISSDADETHDSELNFMSGTSGRGSIVYDHNTTANSQAMIFKTGDNAERVRITSGDGIVGIGVSDPKAHIHTHIASSGGAYHQFTNASTNANSDDGWKIGIHDDENFIIWGQESAESFRVYNNGAYRFTIDHNGAVSVAGSFSKGSGSFKIDHPLPAKKDTHHLVHSFVEAPQADLIYRGTATLSSGTATVNLDTIAGMTEGTYVLLNTNSSCFTSNETDWDAVKGSVSGNTLTITCQNNSSTATVSWLVIGERHDQHMKDTEWTDDNGKVIVEPLKEEG